MASEKVRKIKDNLRLYQIDKINQSVSFLEMLDILNERLVSEGKEPIVFDHDCREGICGMCSLYVNGHPHGTCNRRNYLPALYASLQ